MTATAAQAAALETAFRAFNERSALLERSYRDLQDNVAVLTGELQATQSAHHREVRERQRLAERHARTLEALPAAVVVLDSDGIVRECNVRATEMLAEPLLGCAWSTVVKREFSATRAADGDLQLQNGNILNLKRRWLGSSDGEILLLTDVTESRRMAELLDRQERLSAIGEMTARLAHQIRTPLASALLYASQLTPGTPAGNSPAARIVLRLRELDRLVQDMLRYAGGARDDDQLIDIDHFIADVAETANAQIGTSHPVSVIVGSRGLQVRGNRDALKGALMNLLDNAAAAMSAPGPVELSALATGDQVCLAVSDQGHGIADDQLQAVFEPFFTTRPQGTGLGLAVVRTVAEAHGAEVLVQSGSGGTTIALSLQAASAPDVRSVQPAEIAHA